MSRAIGPIAVIPRTAAAPVPRRVRRPRSRPSSWSTRRSGGSSRRRTTRSPTLLRAHREKLDSLVDALLEHETLDEADAYEAAGLPRNPLARPEPVPPAVGVAGRGRSVAQPGHPRERLVALDDAALDRVLVVSVVHQVPGAVGDLARVLGVRALPQAIDELQLERLDLIGGVAGRKPRKRLAGRLLPHGGRHQQPVSQRDRINRRHARSRNSLGTLRSRVLLRFS